MASSVGPQNIDEKEDEQMTSDRQMQPGETYTAIFEGGPFDGQTEDRPSIDGGYEEVVEQIAAVDTKEMIDVYRATKSHVVGEKVHVSYSWDQQASQNAPAAEDRDGGV
jgi:hypothetical protein